MIRLLYEDEDLLAADKPEGLATIAEADRERDCLLRRLEAQCGRRLFVVHRLDKDASGVVLFARSAGAHSFLGGQFEKRLVRKTYVLLLYGRIAAECGTIEKSLRLFGSGRMGVDEKAGKPSRTEYTVRQRFPGFTLIEARPDTGRRHQLRVHFYCIGNAVVGDQHYGERELQAKFPRLMLHAESIAFRLPGGGEKRIASPLPESFLKALESLSQGKKVEWPGGRIKGGD